MLTLVTAPAAYPVTVAEAKQNIPLYHSDEDDRVEDYIAEATNYLDGYSGILGRALVTQTWQITLPEFEERIRLPLPPVQSLGAITYLDADEASQTFSTAHLVNDGEDTWVERDTGTSWPSTAYRADAVKIQFVTGYGDASAVPEMIKGAVKQYVRARYHMEDDELMRRTIHAMTAPWRAAAF